MTMEILLEPTSNKLCVTNRFTLIVLFALRHSDKENKQVSPHGTRGSCKDGDGDTLFQQSQVHILCSYSIDIYDDMMKARMYVIQDFQYSNTQKVFLEVIMYSR
ncbi:hypothetical protein Tco_0163027 [Tanacetum coccineum]